MEQFSLYKGDGSTLTQRNAKMQPFRTYTQPNAPAGYVASDALREAVNVAIALGQPLLLTGEPGTGKTQLAFSIAYELELGMPHIFNTKTTSTARDLFYRYDSLAHFRDVQMKDSSINTDISKYIYFEALGKAIIESERQRSVVLIDEIDKAPRDLSNDLLNEFENMQFEVKETGKSFKANKENRPILILTSNSEKNLPDAFLRRCVYFHIPFPNAAALEEITRKRLQLSSAFTAQMLNAAITHFTKIRESKGLRKPPATAELLAWVHILDQHNLDVNNINSPEELKKLMMSYSILAKNKEDLLKLRSEG
ncbi:MAG: AAA family ATPase [Bacteroidia bacterium]